MGSNTTFAGDEPVKVLSLVLGSLVPDLNRFHVALQPSSRDLRHLRLRHAGVVKLFGVEDESTQRCMDQGDFSWFLHTSPLFLAPVSSTYLQDPAYDTTLD
jgi:hypothetical protein